MNDAAYFAADGLSNSMLKDLAVSPLRFWFKNINPDRPADEPTAAMQIGSAIHCAVLEPGAFDSRYACEVIPPEGCLVTIDDLRTWIRDHGQTPKGTRKAEVIEQVRRIDPGVPILEELEREHQELHAGKVIFKADDWARIDGACAALLDEPCLESILSAGGKPEAAIFVKDVETGVLLKGKLDWLAPTLTLDLKTFTQKRDSSINKSIADAIWYEQYHRQAYFYALLRGWPTDFDGTFVIAFVESDPPHEVRVKELTPSRHGSQNLFWESARHEVRHLIRLYSQCKARFGDRPWREPREVDPLYDEEIPQLAFERTAR